MMKSRSLLILAAALALAFDAQAAVIQLGKVEQRNGMSVRMLSIQEVTTSHAGHMGHVMDNTGDTTAMPGMHLEAKILMEKAGFGFAPGSWVPYLGLEYRLTKRNTDWTASGQLVPMLANDGPHYGANVPMKGPGTYHMSVTFTPPAPEVFPIHMDKETGVAGWWEPFTLEWDFTYFGLGKKGGY
jgi:uncharacterized protein involved in high-affinity Fe2+ transport